MKDKRQKTGFGGHETFPLRVGWLPKSFRALQEKPRLFADTETAMCQLGVGSNMVKSIRYWLRICGLAEFDQASAEHGATITPLGRALLGPDPYLEDDATLWILHWLIAANVEQATSFFWFFNHFALPRFKDADVLEAVKDFAETTLHLHRKATTLKSDISTLVRLYAAKPGGRSDEHLDALLAPLHLVEADPEGGYRSPRALRPDLPVKALEFALMQCFAAKPNNKELPVQAILYGEDEWTTPAPGAVFRLNEEGLIAHLERLINAHPRRYERRNDGGLHQLFWIDAHGSPDALAVLAGR